MARTNIDFTAGLNQAEIANRNDGGHQSAWVKALAALHVGVVDGPGEYDTFYKIGEFGNASGAQTAIRGLSKRDDLPGLFELRSVIVDQMDEDGTKVQDDNGNVVRVSELWAAVVEDEDDDKGEGGDEPEPEPEPEAEKSASTTTKTAGRSRRRSAA
jgi:hypothetical protein